MKRVRQGRGAYWAATTLVAGTGHDSLSALIGKDLLSSYRLPPLSFVLFLSIAEDEISIRLALGCVFSFSSGTGISNTCFSGLRSHYLSR